MGEAFAISKEELHELIYPALPYRSIEKDYDISKNVNSLICKECGGACCKGCGCHFSPDDFKDLSFKGLKKELEKGYISIDYVDGEMICSPIDVYILRIRNKDKPIVDLKHIRDTPCILLTEKGCKLKYKDRPTGGKLVIPNHMSIILHEMSCTSNYTISKCCFEWLPHKKVLSQLIEYYKDKDFPCSL